MVYDLFSSADFYYSKFSILNRAVWILGLVWIFWKINLFFSTPNRIKKILALLLKWHYEKIKMDMIDKAKRSYLVNSGLFFLVLGMNLWGLFPYVFGITTQIVLTFRISIIMWLRVVSSSIEFSLRGFLSHMTPAGSPGYLAPILNLIELVRNLIRPLTLALRLRINITTGHVLISLISSSAAIVFFNSFPMWTLLRFLIGGYLLFEVGICFIQGFVFRLLKAQYLREHTH